MVWMPRYARLVACTATHVAQLPHTIETYLARFQLKAKRDAKYSVAEEEKVVAWMEELTGLSKGDKTFAEWLKVRRCALGLRSVAGIFPRCRTALCCAPP